MAGYVVADLLSVRDPDSFGEYREKVGATIEQYGGQFRVVGGTVDALEGDWQPTLVVLEFESAERARAWYDSDEYRPLKELRHRSADARLIIVEGV